MEVFIQSCGFTGQQLGLYAECDRGMRTLVSTDTLEMRYEAAPHANKSEQIYYYSPSPDIEFSHSLTIC